MSIDDIVALVGLLSLISGIYLWLGLPATLMMLGVVLIIIGWRMPPKVKHNEPDKTNNTTVL